MENKKIEKKQKYNEYLKSLGFLFILVSIFFFIKSENVMDFGKIPKLVGGDAYNYIIAANQSTAFVVKAVFFAILGSVSLVMSKN